MSGGTIPGQPQLVLPLRDGQELRIGDGVIAIGSRTVALAAVQDARQVSPEPLTIALRVQGAGLVEFQPARPTDGAIAQEAIYRLRPDLRPFGFESPTDLPPGMPPLPIAPPVPPVPPYGYGQPPMGTYPPGYPPAAPTFPGYGYPPAPGYPPVPPYGMPPIGPYGYNAPPKLPGPGRLQPTPRDIGTVLGAGFAIFGTYWRQLLLIAFATLIVPYIAQGFLQWQLNDALVPIQAKLSDPNYLSSTRNPFAIYGDLLPLLGVVALVSLLTLPLAVLARGAFGAATREALLGRPVNAGAALRSGLRRFFPMLGTMLLVGIIELALILVFLLVIFGGFIGILALSASGGSGTTSDSSGATTAGLLLLLLFLGGCLLYLVVIGAFIFVSTRLAAAPYLAATAPVGPVSAISGSWRLTARNFWRTFLVTLVAGVISFAISLLSSSMQILAAPVAWLVLYPILTVTVVALESVLLTTLLYDLRVRREGYASVVPPEPPPMPTTPTPPYTSFPAATPTSPTPPTPPTYAPPTPAAPPPAAPDSPTQG